MKRYMIGIFVFVTSVCGPASAKAAPIDYAINFMAPSGTVTPTGSFTYDRAAPLFTNFIVEFQGLSIDLTVEANAPYLFGTLPCLGGTTGAAASFALMSGDCNYSANPSWFALAFPGFASFAFKTEAPNGVAQILDGIVIGGGLFYVAEGRWSITRTSSVPEPGSLTLTLTALLALVFFGRRRLTASYRPANRMNC